VEAKALLVIFAIFERLLNHPTVTVARYHFIIWPNLQNGPWIPKTGK
jgi:hypothetical protein